MLIHCRNSLCKYYWEDSCMIILENKLLALDENGKCKEQKEGISDYYKEGWFLKYKNKIVWHMVVKML